MTEDMIKEAEDMGFEVVDEVDIGSLDDVKPMPRLLPAARGVKLRIKKVTPVSNDDNTFRSLNIQFSLIEGIMQADENGEEKLKFANMSVFTRVTYYADPKVYTKQFFKNRHYLNDLKMLLNSLNLTDKSKINDVTFKEMMGQALLGDIIQRKGNVIKDEEGKPVIGPDGQQQRYDATNQVTNFKPMSAESQV